MSLMLKKINFQFGIPLRLYEAKGIHRTWISRIQNRDYWPVKKDKDELKKLIQTILSEHLVPQNIIDKAFQEDPDVKERKYPAVDTNKSKHELTSQDKLFLKGVAMLPQPILARFKLTRDPFSNELETSSDVFYSTAHQLVLQKMIDAAKNQKFLGIHGSVGSGKTVLKNVFIEQLMNERNFLVSEPMIVEKYKCKESAISDALIEDLMYARGSISQIGKMRSPRSLEAKNRLVRTILANNRRQGRKAVLIIDEAHELPLETLKALKRFHEHQDGFRKLLGIIILGQEELHDKLTRDYRVREVTARIDLVELKPIAPALQQYLEWKISRAGGVLSHLFSEKAIEEMKVRLNGANPLMINVLASHALIKGFQLDNSMIDSEIVEMAYKEMAG